MIDDLKGKRDINDRAWNYPMEDDEERFGIGHFNVLSDEGDQYLTILEKTGSTLTWKQELIQEYKLEISTANGKNFTFTNLTDQSNPISTTFVREGDGNVNWEVALGGKSFYVKLIRRNAGKFAVYDVKSGDTTKQYLNFNNPTDSPVTICADSENKDQSYIDLNGTRITNGNYQTGRGVKARAIDNHLKVNGSAVAFVNEVETVTASVSALSGDVVSLGSSVSAIATSLSAYATKAELSSYVSVADLSAYATTSALSAYATTSAVNASVSALGSSISAIAGSLNVSGIGCSTVTMSGVFADTTSFTYNVVIQPTI